MADLEKVIKGLRCHSEPKFGPDEYFCETCPYDEATCGLDVPNDALSLLKAQEPRVMTLEEAIETVSKEGGFVWIEEKNHPLSSPHIRPTNSIYDCPVRKFKDYGKEFVPKRNTLRSMWRCWTFMPSEEQRKKVKWE